MCLLLGWLSVAGFGNAWLSFTGRDSMLPRWFALLALAYGLASGIACVGLWRMRDWGIRSLRVWMGVCGAIYLAFVFANPIGGVPGGYLSWVGFLLIVAPLFVVVDRYVRRKLVP